MLTWFPKGQNQGIGYYSIYIARPKSPVVSLTKGQLPDARTLLQSAAIQRCHETQPSWVKAGILVPNASI
jgi:hypothetical protein